MLRQPENILIQGVQQTSFCQGPDGKYFQLCQPQGIGSTLQLCHCRVKAARDQTVTVGMAGSQWSLLQNRQLVDSGPQAAACWPLCEMKVPRPGLMFAFVVVWSLSYVWLFCDPMDCSPAGSSVHRISQARILERIAISFSRASSWPRDWSHVSCIAGRFFTIEPPESPIFTLFSFYSWGCSTGCWAPSKCSVDSFFINLKNVMYWNNYRSYQPSTKSSVYPLLGQIHPWHVIDQFNVHSCIYRY